LNSNDSFSAATLHFRYCRLHNVAGIGEEQLFSAKLLNAVHKLLNAIHTISHYLIIKTVIADDD
jgi:hypothetical protein